MQLPLCVLAAVLIFAAGCSPKRTEQTSAYRIYVTNEVSGDMSVIDSGTLQVLAKVPLGKRPRGIHAAPDRKAIYVALSGSPIAGPGVDESTLPPADKSADGIGVFDVQENRLVRTIKSGSDPEEFAISNDGRRLYVSNEDASALSIVDVKTGQVIHTVATGEEPEGVTLTPDNRFVYVTSENEGTVAVIDTSSAKRVTNIKVGRRPRSVLFTRDGSRAYVTCENDGHVAVIDTAAHRVIQTIPLGQVGVIKPMGLRLAPDASRIFVSTGRGKQVFFIDPATNQPIGSVEAGTRPWGMAVSPDGKTLYTANGPSNDVSVVDIASRSVTRRIPSEGSPWGVITLERP
jgi:YVTN family beta-propeller protein